MKFSTVTFFISVDLEVLITIVLGSRVHYEAIFDDTMSFVYSFYRREMNSVPPSPNLDPAVADPSIRLQICEEISRSGLFQTYGKKSVDMKNFHRELQQSRYSDFFDQIYKRAESLDTSSPDVYEYNNPYTVMDLRINGSSSSPGSASMFENEYIFVCLLRKSNTGVPSSKKDSDGEDSLTDAATVIADTELDSSENTPVNSSSSGNESGAHDSDMENAPGNANTEGAVGGENIRVENLNEGDLQNFLATVSPTDWEGVDLHLSDADVYTSDSDVDLENDDDDDPNGIIPFLVTKIYDAHRGFKAHRFIFTLQKNHNIMLAEGAAKVSSRPDFNIELHYLELRKRHEPVSSYNDDPVCRLKESSQVLRLCTVVLTSPFFKGKVTYPFTSEGQAWFRFRKVSFRTKEGLAEAAGRTFFEFVVRCYATKVGGNGDVQFFHISRAYHPNEVFVYSSEDSNAESPKMYLENLSTHVGIVHERYNLGEVEI